MPPKQGITNKEEATMHAAGLRLAAACKRHRPHELPRPPQMEYIVSCEWCGKNVASTTCDICKSRCCTECVLQHAHISQDEMGKWNLRFTSFADVPATPPILVPDVSSLRLAADTIAQYRRDTLCMVKAAVRWAFRSLLQDFFLRWVQYLLMKDYSASRIETFRAALVMHQKDTMPQSAWYTASTLFKDKFKGLLRLAKPAMVRGAITILKLHQLVSMCDRVGLTEYARGFVFGYYALLRHGELMDATVDNLIVGDKLCGLRIFGAKAHADEWDIAPLTDIVVLATFLKSRGSGRALVFPDWDPILANSLIRDAALEFTWELSFQWSFHCLRHGRNTDLTLQKVPEATRRLLGRWRSDAEKTYGRVDVSSLT